jgi:hypothetical protein
MSRLEPVIASNIVAMTDDDWIVSMQLESGQVVHRRVSPGTMSEPDAIKRAATTISRARIVEIRTKRFRESRKIVVPGGS